VSDGITTNYVHGLKFTGYTYYPTSGYTYTTNTESVIYSTNYDCPSTTNYTYTYPATNYFQYANILSYTYQVTTYTYPQVASYSYTISTVTYLTNSYDAVLSNGCYFATSLGNTIVTGPSALVIASNFPISFLTIVPGGSLSVYVESGICALTPQLILNATGVASNFQVLCAPAVSSVTLGGAASFVGIIDAPEANATITAAGRTYTDYSGTLVANSLNVSGHLRMHSDESLGQWGYLLFPAAPWSPRLYGPYMLTNGQLGIRIDSAPGDNCVVETSTDLVNWNPVFTNSGFFYFTDTNGFGPGQCFYRAIYVQ
jgi:hypothetical protein